MQFNQFLSLFLVVSLLVGTTACSKKAEPAAPKMNPTEAIIGIDSAVETLRKDAACTVKVNEFAKGVELKEYETIIDCQPQKIDSIDALNSLIARLQTLSTAASQALDSSLNLTQQNYARSVLHATGSELYSVRTILNKANLLNASLAPELIAFEKKWNCKLYSFPFECDGFTIASNRAYFAKRFELLTELETLQNRFKNLMWGTEVQLKFNVLKDNITLNDKYAVADRKREFQNQLPSYVLEDRTTYRTPMRVYIDGLRSDKALLDSLYWDIFPKLIPFFKPDSLNFINTPAADHLITEGIRSISFSTNAINSAVQPTLSMALENKCQLQDLTKGICETDSLHKSISLGFNLAVPNGSEDINILLKDLKTKISEFYPEEISTLVVKMSDSYNSISNYGALINFVPYARMTNVAPQRLFDFLKRIDVVLKKNNLHARDSNTNRISYYVLITDNTFKSEKLSTHRRLSNWPEIPIAISIDDTEDVILSKLQPHLKK